MSAGLIRVIVFWSLSIFAAGCGSGSNGEQSDTGVNPQNPGNAAPDSEDGTSSDPSRLSFVHQLSSEDHSIRIEALKSLLGVERISCWSEELPSSSVSLDQCEPGIAALIQVVRSNEKTENPVNLSGAFREVRFSLGNHNGPSQLNTSFEWGPINETPGATNLGEWTLRRNDWNAERVSFFARGASAIASIQRRAGILLVCDGYVSSSVEFCTTAAERFLRFVNSLTDDERSRLFERNAHSIIAPMLADFPLWEESNRNIRSLLELRARALRVATMSGVMLEFDIFNVNHFSLPRRLNSPALMENHIASLEGMVTALENLSRSGRLAQALYFNVTEQSPYFMINRGNWTDCDGRPATEWGPAIVRETRADFAIPEGHVDSNRLEQTLLQAFTLTQHFRSMRLSFEFWTSSPNWAHTCDAAFGRFAPFLQRSRVSIPDFSRLFGGGFSLYCGSLPSDGVEGNASSDHLRVGNNFAGRSLRALMRRRAEWMRLHPAN